MKQHSLYSVLHLSHNATQKEIKQAYYQLISKYPPEKEPERFKTIRAAYETLSEPKAREAYDSIKLYPDEVQGIYEEFETFKFEKNWPEAISKLKKILEIMPEADGIRNQLGMCKIYSGQLDEALKVFEHLVLKNPGVGVYWNNYGQCLKLKAEQYPEGEKRFKIYEKARGYFQKSIEYKSESSQPYLAISDMYLHEKKYDAAIEWANNAISADGQIDFNDFEAMFQLCKIYLYSENIDEIDKIIKRIIEIIPEDKDYHRYVSTRFAMLGEKLLSIFEFESSIHFFRGALRFKPDNDQLKDFLNKAEKGAKALKEYETFAKDNEIIKPFRKMGAIDVSKLLGKEVPGEKELIDDISHQVSMVSIQSIISSVSLVRSKYVGIYRLNHRFYDLADNAAREKKQSLA
jgi:tetratricopeptide (TPR) repeat protein